jgi:hypothetical protein
MKRPSG